MLAGNLYQEILEKPPPPLFLDTFPAINTILRQTAFNTTCQKQKTPSPLFCFDGFDRQSTP